MLQKIPLALAVVAVLALAWTADRLRQHPDMADYSDYFTAAAGPGQPDTTTGAVTVTFLGNTTLLITDGQTSLMTDGFFTRPDMASLLFGRLEPDSGLIRAALQRAGVTRLAAVIPAHSHHDHAMDAPEVARQTGALLLGSASSANIGRGWGLPESQIRVVEPAQAFHFGNFKVTLLQSRHAPMPAPIAALTGHGETIAAPFIHPARLHQYKEGGSYTVVIEHPRGNLLIQPSAGYVEGLLDGFQADTAFLGIAGLGRQTSEYRHNYFRETAGAVAASHIVPIHWDDFTRPYSQPLQPFSTALNDFDTAIDFLLHQARSTSGGKVTIMQMWESITL